MIFLSLDQDTQEYIKIFSKSTGYYIQEDRLEKPRVHWLSKSTGKNIKEYRLGYSRVEVRIFKRTV